MKEKLKLRVWVKITIGVLLIALSLLLLKPSFKTHTQTKTTQHKEMVKEEEKTTTEGINEVLEVVEEKQEIEEQFVEQEEVQKENIQENASYEEITIIDTSYATRMTSYWADDGYGTGNCTGSGLCSWDLQTNEKGWYTYQGKLVVAAATTYLANRGWYVGDGVHLYKYGDELTLMIDGIEYDAIVKDSCGNCMKTDRIDLFVINEESSKDTNIEVRS